MVETRSNEVSSKSKTTDFWKIDNKIFTLVTQSVASAGNRSIFVDSSHQLFQKKSYHSTFSQLPDKTAVFELLCLIYSSIYVDFFAPFQMDMISPENCYAKECMKEMRKRKIEVEEDEVKSFVFLKKWGF